MKFILPMEELSAKLNYFILGMTAHIKISIVCNLVKAGTVSELDESTGRIVPPPPKVFDSDLTNNQKDHHDASPTPTPAPL